MLRNRLAAPLAAAALAAGCGSPAQNPNLLKGFNPKAPAADQLQVLGPIVRDIAPGADVTLCSYLETSVDGDTDVLSFETFQSASGHHVVLYVARMPRAPITKECTEADMVGVRYLAAGGQDSSGNAFTTLPEGLSFRVPAGAQLMMQTHWINAGQKAIDGQGAVNLRTQPASGARVPADMVAVAATDFRVPAGQKGDAVTTCLFQEELTLFLLGGHQHYKGTGVKIEHVDGAQATLLYDHAWQRDYVSNPPVRQWPKEAPLRVKVGQGLRVTCGFDNTDGGAPLDFPTEMCAMWGFYFPGRGEIPCGDGHWPSR